MAVRAPLHLLFSRLNRPSSLTLSYTMCSSLPQTWWSAIGLTLLCQHLSCTQGPQTGHSRLVWDHSTRHLEVPDRGEESLFSACWLHSCYTVWAHAARDIAGILCCKGTLQQIRMHDTLFIRTLRSSANVFSTQSQVSIAACGFLILDRGSEASALKQIAAPNPSSPPDWPPYFSSYWAYIYTGFSHGEHWNN